MAFTIFYDGNCPLCMKEIRHLMHKDRHNRLAFEDINANNFSERFPQLSVSELDKRIHGMESDGQILRGLDVTHRAWSLVGYPWLYAPLRWPLIKPLADKAYVAFAKRRHKIARLFSSDKSCEKNCEIKKP